MPDAHRSAEAWIVQHVPPVQFAGPVAVGIRCTFRAPKSGPNKGRQPGEPYVGKPDADNVAKLVLDAIVRAGMLDDDTQVSDLHVSRRWGTEHSTDVSVWRVPGPPSVGQGDVVADIVDYLRARCTTEWDAVASLLESRRQAGIATYGRPLRYLDGRGEIDMIEELADAAQYGWRDGYGSVADAVLDILYGLAVRGAL
jgi:Holliday junction resolvase RusA-like endonuclease